MPHQISVVGCDEDGHFKATVLWEKIVAHLEDSIKCGRHSQSLRTYADCFQGSKAIDCLLAFLNKIMTKSVKRHQVQTLCEKLVLMNVMEEVRDKEKGVFREGRLYRLTRNHFWTNPSERMKLPRARSAEDICVEKLSNCNDLKGYASDSTVSTHPAIPSQDPPLRKKRKCKERVPGSEQQGHYTKEFKAFPPPRSSPPGSEQQGHYTKEFKAFPPPRPSPPGSDHYTKEFKAFPPPRLSPPGSEQQGHYTEEFKALPLPRLSLLDMGIVKMKSTGSILHTPDCTPLCESRENLLFDTRHRRKTSAHRRPVRTDAFHNLRRRGSVEDWLGQPGRVCEACGGGFPSCKPPKRGAKVREDSSRHHGKEQTLKCRRQTRSFKGEKDKERSRKDSHRDDDEDCFVGKSTLNRSLSFSSVGDYEATAARAHFEPIHSSTSGSKWIVYGFF